MIATVRIPPEGSSPHTRGTLKDSGSDALSERFIPAYAGNAAMRQAFGRRWTVHPRIRGERGPSVLTSCSTSGSSPHTRGTHATLGGYIPHIRFIPAYAGNARQSLQSAHRVAVHPRIRGERCGADAGAVKHAGSSPHTRGTRPLAKVISKVLRFIPAYAGNALVSPA